MILAVLVLLIAFGVTPRDGWLLFSAGISDLLLLLLMEAITHLRTGIRRRLQ